MIQGEIVKGEISNGIESVKREKRKNWVLVLDDETKSRGGGKRRRRYMLYLTSTQ